jgi:hypothetical protein
MTQGEHYPFVDQYFCEAMPPIKWTHINISRVLIGVERPHPNNSDRGII